MLKISHKFLNLQSFKYFASLQRAACSGRFPQLPSQETLQNTSNEESAKSQVGYGEKEIFLLGPADIRTPLPGNMGIPPLSVLCVDTISQLPKPAGEKCEVTTGQLPEERYQTLLTQAACAATENALSSYALDCTAYDCPQLLKKDFSDLFPHRDLSAGSLTVITLCQRTLNDMSIWSESAELERASLESCFLTAAAAICAQLKNSHYWADFIHPNSGKPHFSPVTNATLFETDLRYRQLGFTIEDLGCCRIILHKDWGTRVFVGALFTNAPLHGREVSAILDHHHRSRQAVERDLDPV